MFQALSNLKSFVSATVNTLFGLAPESKPVSAAKPANGNGNHMVAKPVVEAPKAETMPPAPVDNDEDDGEGLVNASPIEGLAAVIAQATAMQASAAPATVEVAPVAAEAPKAEAVVVAKPVSKPPQKAVDTRPRCKLVVCDEPFTPPPGYTEGYCAKCDPEGHAFAKGHAASRRFNVCIEADCHRPDKKFEPPAQFPGAVRCPECHQEMVARRKANTAAMIADRMSEARQASQARSSSMQQSLSKKQADEAKLREERRKAQREAAFAAEQLRLKLEGRPTCKEASCQKYYVPFYEGAEYCRDCARAYKARQEQQQAAQRAKAQAEATEHAKAVAELAARGVITDAVRKQLFDERVKLFVAGKEMPEGTTFTRSGTQITFVVMLACEKKVSITGHCDLTKSELADAEARKAELEAAKRKADAERAEKERKAKADAAQRKELATQYLAGTLPEGVTAEQTMEAGSGKKAEAKPKIKFIFSDGSEPIIMDPPTKEDPKKKGKDADKKGGKNKGKKLGSPPNTALARSLTTADTPARVSQGIITR